MSVGRNDPCPCGSGKKYKKCCLAKDEEAKQVEQAKPIGPAPRAARSLASPPDLHTQAIKERWEAFEGCDYEGRIQLFTQTLEEPKMMDGEMAFEMLSQLFQQTLEHCERDRFDALVGSLAERLPKVYAGEAHYFLTWQITNALVAGRDDRVSTLVRQLAPLAGNAIDIWNRTESMLAYHGQLSVLVEATPLAWAKVRRSKDVAPWGVDEFVQRGMNYALLDHVERTPVPDAADPALLARLEYYGEYDLEGVAAYLAHITGQASRAWTLRDFEFAPPSHRAHSDWDDDEEEDETASDLSTGERNLYDLSIEFLGYLHRVEGMPYTKGELGCRTLRRFIEQRQAGELEYHESMLESLMRDQGYRGRHPSKPKYRRHDHPLIPDRERLDHFLGGLLQVFNQCWYEAATTFEILPAWLRFLESRRLIEAELRVRALAELETLHADLLKGFSYYADDPAPQQALERWVDEAMKEQEAP
jgi:hypothetical protein